MKRKKVSVLDRFSAYWLRSSVASFVLHLIQYQPVKAFSYFTEKVFVYLNIKGKD